ncbi:MAG TPA: pitrilysin family protein [Verrucomicrobiales bacterium]|nr:pitrilysin family protein [Verrucomicrobiales bacterium]
MTTHHILRLKTGEILCVAEMPHMESVSLGIWAGVGGRHDPSDLGGLAHFVEHMIFKGTKRRSARRLNTEIESVGGSMDAYTSEDHTAFFVRGPGEHMPRFADVLLDIYRHSVFTAEDMNREREVISEEIAMYKEQPQQQAEDLLWKSAWPDHPLGRPIAGTEDSLQRINIRALRDHAGSWFGRRNTIISVAGRVEAAHVQEVLEKILARGLPDGQTPRARPFPVRTLRKAPRIALEKREIDQVQLALAFHVPGRSSDRNAALRLLNVILGENTSSRLWSSLREDHGLCYDVGSDLTSLSETGLLHIFAGVDPDKLPKALRVMMREFSKLVAKAVTPRALKAACEYVLGSARMSLEAPASQMTGMAECLLFYERFIPADEYEKRLRSVTPEEIHALTKKVFTPANLTAALVGPVPDKEAIAKMLVLN